MHRTPPPKPSAGGQSDGFLNRRSQVRDLPRALKSPTATPDHPPVDVEHRLRAIVVAGLLPMLLGCVAGHPPSYANERAGQVLGLLNGAPRLTNLGRTVAQRLAALHLGRQLPPMSPTVAWWGHVLLARGEPSTYGTRLVPWLEEGTVDLRCGFCAERATGVVLTACPGDGTSGHALACPAHASFVETLAASGLDRHLAEIGGVR